MGYGIIGYIFMTTVVKATSKGQITLPAVWRRKFDTSQFILDYSGNTVKIYPLDTGEIIEKKKTDERVVFNAIRDNKGRGVNAKELLKVLKKIDG